MISDSITSASIHAAPNNNNHRDLGKKKRRSAKLKQCKLDVRREQWLSQGAVRKEEPNGVVQGRKDRNKDRAFGNNLEVVRPRGGGNDGSILHHHHDSDLESNSPTNLMSSVLSSNYSETNFTGSSSSSSSCGGCCSGNITEDEEGGGGGDDDECLDDWEAVADALAADEKPKNLCSESPSEHNPIAQSVFPQEMAVGVENLNLNSKPQCASAIPKASGNGLAWRPDDTFRPQSLPILAKQLSLPNSNRKHYGCSGVPWAYSGVVSAPSSCPICYEDLDLTDTSFLPCLCGFRLCLFCHKRILEEDGRCPGCRKPYEHEPVEAEASVHGGSLTFRLPRSCSMTTRS